MRLLLLSNKVGALTDLDQPAEALAARPPGARPGRAVRAAPRCAPPACTLPAATSRPASGTMRSRGRGRAGEQSRRVSRACYLRRQSLLALIAATGATRIRRRGTWEIADRAGPHPVPQSAVYLLWWAEAVLAEQRGDDAGGDRGAAPVPGAGPGRASRGPRICCCRCWPGWRWPQARRASRRRQRRRRQRRRAGAAAAQGSDGGALPGARPGIRARCWRRRRTGMAPGSPCGGRRRWRTRRAGRGGRQGAGAGGAGPVRGRRMRTSAHVGREPGAVATARAGAGRRPVRLSAAAGDRAGGVDPDRGEGRGASRRRHVRTRHPPASRSLSRNTVQTHALTHPGQAARVRGPKIVRVVLGHA